MPPARRESSNSSGSDMHSRLRVRTTRSTSGPASKYRDSPASATTSSRTSSDVDADRIHRSRTPRKRDERMRQNIHPPDRLVVESKNSPRKRRPPIKQEAVDDNDQEDLSDKEDSPGVWEDYQVLDESGVEALETTLKKEPAIKEDDEEDQVRTRVNTRSSRKTVFESPPAAPKSTSTYVPSDSRSTSHEERVSSEEYPESPVKRPGSTEPIKRRLRSSRKDAAGHDHSPSTSAYGQPDGRRYPARSCRPPPGSFNFTGLIDVSDVTSSESGDGPPKKKIKRANVGASSSAGTFEPTIYFPIKEISFETVGGYLPIKEELRRSVVIPFRQRMRVSEENKRDGTNKTVDMTRGALFWGPPGTGKTLMAKALAYECSKDLERTIPVYIISGAELLTKWVGESESHLREIFHHASENSPSIIFMDELDGLVRKRTNSDNDSVNFNMVSTLLTLLNGATDRGTVLAIATTNFKEVLDPALLRSGRFDLKIHFPSPVESERALILQALTQNWTSKLDSNHAYTLARNTAGFTGADLDLLCKKAKNIACQRSVESVSGDIPWELETEVLLSDFFSAWQEVEPSGGAITALPYEPLSPLLQPLLQDQLKSLYTEVARSFSVRIPTQRATVSHLETAAWAAFSQPGLLLAFDPVIFIHSEDDAMLLDLVVPALFHLLADKNTIKTVNFKSSANERVLAADVQSFIQDRSAILGLLRIDMACVPVKGDKFQLVDSVYDVLARRDKLRCPLLVITSTLPMKAYGSTFRKLLGAGCKEFHLTLSEQPTCLAFFKDMFLNEAVRTAREDGQMVEILEPGTRDAFNKSLVEVATVLSGRNVEVLLMQHQRLSAALNQDRKTVDKPIFNETIKAILEDFEDDGDSSGGDSPEESD